MAIFCINCEEVICVQDEGCTGETYEEYSGRI